MITSRRSAPSISAMTSPSHSSVAEAVARLEDAVCEFVVVSDVLSLLVFVELSECTRSCSDFTFSRRFIGLFCNRVLGRRFSIGWGPGSVISISEFSSVFSSSSPPVSSTIGGSCLSTVTAGGSGLVSVLGTELERSTEGFNSSKKITTGTRNCKP